MAAQVIQFTASTGSVSYTLPTSLSPSTTYTITVYSELQTGDGTFYLSWYDGSDHFSSAFKATISWQRSAGFTFTTGANAVTNVAISNFAAAGTVIGAGNIAFFGLEVEPGSAATTFVGCQGATTVAPPPPPPPAAAGTTNILLAMDGPPNASVSTNPVGMNTSELTGRPLDAYLDYTDFNNLSHWQNGQSQGGSWPVDAPVVTNIYMCPLASLLAFDLGTAAAGEYNSYYTSMGQGLATSAAKIYVVCTQNEINLNQSRPWDMGSFGITGAGAANIPNYIATQRNQIIAFKNAFVAAGKTPPKIGWKTNVGHFDPTLVYPGDDVIDIIVMDLYAAPTFSGTNDADCWANALSGGGPYAGVTVQGYTQGWGLNVMAQFAAAHGKPMGFDEWGWGFNSSQYVTNFLTWCNNNNVVYHSPWQDTTPAAGINFAMQSYPLAKQAYNNFYQNTRYAGTFFTHF